MTVGHEHHCDDPENFPLEDFLQRGEGKGARLLVVGASLAPEGWRKSGRRRPFYDVKRRRLIPSGRNLNELLQDCFGLSIETCGFTDLVKCYVPDNDRLLQKCGHRCWRIFERQLQSQDFRLLILLGKDTLKIFNKEVHTSLDTGELTKVKMLDSEYSVLPIYHTSPRNPKNHPKNRRILNKLSSELNRLLADAGS